ncbi:MAG: alpha-1,4-glucan--maltose-1-phosphate maltosyltransferase [Gemmatimonadota bacterium]
MRDESRKEQATIPKERSRSPEEGRKRAKIEGVEPQIDGGTFPAKRILGDEIIVEADAFCDGHDALTCILRYRHESEQNWRSTDMEPLGNDRWRASFEAARLGHYLFKPVAWVDHFKTWRLDLHKRLEAGQEVTQELLIGADLVEAAADRADAKTRPLLQEWVTMLRHPTDDPDLPVPSATETPMTPSRATAYHALSSELAELVALCPDRTLATEYGTELSVQVDREKARFSTWYELFPRSAAETGRHGTFEDVERLLPYIKDMGFDVLYLPPIHPIGRMKRKGPNNVPTAEDGDPGSPWGIGAKEGGHKAVHPELGTLDDFRRLLRKVEEEDMEIALDIALQCAPDHPYVRDHPEWFRKRPDGSIQYAENPPKKYQDIYPFDFETDAWRELWDELASIFLFWIEQGVRIFRVDNPHTKPFDFWQWMIARVRAEHPDVIFLSEAFTRPKVMYRLAKLGFSQSYTYFTWRNSKDELRDYVETLTTEPVRDFFRPNFWPNTPDILPEYLQTGGRPGFMVRLALAATLTSNYGIYGPAFELQAAMPARPGSEEYLHSEKYEIREWDLDRADSLRGFIGRVNRIRRENPALQETHNVRFHDTDNDEILAYSKATRDGSNVVLVVVNLDPHHRQSGWVDLDLDALGVGPDDTHADHEEYVVHDELGGERFLWHGSRSYVELRPDQMPVHIFRVSRRARSEADFEYYM